VESLEWLLHNAYQFAAMWQGVELPEDFQLAIFRDFGLVHGRIGDLELLQADRTARNITLETYLKESKRRGLYGDDMDPAEEAAAAQDEQQQALATMLPGPGSGIAKPPANADTNPDGSTGPPPKTATGAA
jgi:hypothetical protein